MNSYNVNTTSQVLKEENEQTQPYQLGNFISNGESQSEQMKNVATLNDKSINGNVDPVLLEIQKLQQSISSIEQKVTMIENDGIKGKDLDAQVVQALKDIKQYAAFFEQATFQMETKILKTSMSIAKKIIGIELGENSTQIAKETINSMIGKVKSASKVSVHLNPKDFVLLKDQLSFEPHIILLEDSNVTAGGVVIASDLGNFDGSVESKIQSMLESLEGIA